MKSNVPKANSEIDESWLKSVMNRALNKEIQVLAVNDIEQKHGFVNGVKTAEIKTDEKIIKLFLKFTVHPIGSYSKMVQSYNCHQREVQTYQEVLPKMIDFELKYGSSDLQGKYPNFFYGDFDQDGFCLIMEDHSENYFMKSINQGLNFAQAKSCLEMIASFHAISYAMFQKEPKLGQKWKFAPVHKTFGENQWYQGIIEQNWEALIKDLTKEKLTLVKPLKGLKSQWLSVYRQVTDFGPQPFLIHGDLWANNVMFSDQNDVLVFDWPFLGRDHPIVDVAHFILVGLDPDQLELWWEKLLNVYCAEFTRKLKTFGYFEPKMVQELQDWFWTKGTMLTIMMWIAGYQSVMYKKPELRRRFLHLLEKSIENSPADYFSGNE